MDAASSMTSPPVAAPTTPPAAGASFCPEKAPKDGASCAGVLSANMSSGNCEWHSSSTDSKGATLTENDYCNCSNNHDYPNPPKPNQSPTWDCSGDAESSMTSPPVAAPTTPPTAGATTGKKIGVQQPCQQKLPPLVRCQTEMHQVPANTGQKTHTG